MNKIFKSSKWMHKYIGLALAFFLIWMSLSGILLNHPDLISSIDLPAFLTPPQYRFSNWNRGAASVLVTSQKDSTLSFIGGKAGIWQSRDNYRNYFRMTKNFPVSTFYGKTNSLLLVEDFNKNLLLAGMDGGLFVYDITIQNWQKIDLPSDRKKIVKILRFENNCMVFTESELFVSKIDANEFRFFRKNLMRQNAKLEISLVRYFFNLHSGEFLHLAGRLFFDLMGLFIVFLSVSAIILWVFPKYRSKFKFKNRQMIFKYSFKYHLKFGIWVATILLIIGVSGFFMRPPPLAILANKFIATDYYPGFFPENPWHRKIQNAAILNSGQKLIIAAEDGIWSGSVNFDTEFTREKFGIPIFIMGATVFETPKPDQLLAGSFNGLYEYNFSANKCRDYIKGHTIFRVKSNIEPADTMITAWFNLNDGREFVFAHEQGLLKPPQDIFRIDTSSIRDIKMPLWNFLFELHNGRIFKDLIGGLYILLLPIGSILFVLIILSGIYDWLFLKFFRRRKVK